MNRAINKAHNSNRNDFFLTGLDCADCARKIEKSINDLEGVHHASVNFGASTMIVEHSLSTSKIIDFVSQLGYKAYLKGEQPKRLSLLYNNWGVILTLVSGIFLLAGILGYFLNYDLRIVFYAAAVITGGIYPARKAFSSLKNGFVFDINVLMIIAVSGAVAIGEWAEAAVVIFLFSVGNTLELYTMEKTRQSIRGMMDLAPKEAVVVRNEKEELLPVENINVGDILIIRPGESIPIDGEVVSGSTTVDQAPITGEWAPVEKNVGEKVFAGTINELGSIRIQAAKLVQDTTLAKIIQLIEEAESKRAPSQRFIDKFASYYTPAVIVMAFIIAVVPPVLFQAPFHEWLYRALMLLVISCPCALVISTPVTIVSAIGNAARNGVLIKGGVYLEEAGAVTKAFFDKTGTLTEGKPKITNVINTAADSREELMKIAGGIEQLSEHPLAAALMDYIKGEGIDYYEPENFLSYTGKGVEAEIKGKKYYAGSCHFFEDYLKVQDQVSQKIVSRLQEEGKTTVLIGDEERVLGVIAAADTIRTASKIAINRIKELGIKTIMLTGDNNKTAARIASELGIDDYKSELLPEDKVNVIRNEQQSGSSVIMVGDGINDAPALTSASVGIAMGGAGTDTALETADMVLMADDLEKLPFSMNLSKKTLKIIKQNIVVAIGIKFAALALAFPGILTLWLAIFADTGAALIVILNGMRLLRFEDNKKDAAGLTVCCREGIS